LKFLGLIKKRNADWNPIVTVTPLRNSNCIKRHTPLVNQNTRSSRKNHSFIFHAHCEPSTR
jgi:hypothetical protein